VFIDGFAGMYGSVLGAVFDGHGGTECVEFLEKRLFQVLKNEVTAMINVAITGGHYQPNVDASDGSTAGQYAGSLRPGDLDQILKQSLGVAFQLTDAEFVYGQKPSGSTATVILTALLPETHGTRLYHSCNFQ